MPRSRSTASKRSRRRPGSPRATAIRIHEAVGASTRSWSAAVADAVRGAKEAAPDPVAVEVGRLWADIRGSRIHRYRAAVRIAYRDALVPPRPGSGPGRRGAIRRI